jgi:hypothetical protein
MDVVHDGIHIWMYSNESKKAICVTFVIMRIRSLIFFRRHKSLISAPTPLAPNQAASHHVFENNDIHDAAYLAS